MQLIHVAAASLNQTPLAWDANKKNILRSISMAKKQGVSILCLPELCIPGYGCEDAFQAPGLLHTAEEILQEITPHTQGIIVAIGLPRMHRGGLFNTCCLVADGQIIGFAAKQNLAGSGIHYEPRWFKAWPSGTAGKTEITGDLIRSEIYFSIVVASKLVSKYARTHGPQNAPEENYLRQVPISY